MSHTPHLYSPLEEKLNIGSHGLGLLLSIVGIVFLIIHAARFGGALHIATFSVFGGSLILLYLASTLYHGSQNAAIRSRLRAFDHAAIYVLIAGTYTPFTLLVLKGTVGWLIFGITWGLAAIGIVLKIFYTGRFDGFSTAMYVLMGWIIVFAIKPLMASFPAAGIAWLVGGGIAYTVGALFYSIKRMPFGHATFHGFVLLGSICHFVAVYRYVLT